MIHISSSLGDRTYCGLAFDPSIKRVRKLRGATCQDCIYIWKSGRDVVRAKQDGPHEPGLVHMSAEELEKLPEYSRSVPTFTKLGKEVLGVRRWRRKIDTGKHAGWWIGEASVGEGSYITIKWSKVVLA